MHVDMSCFGTNYTLMGAENGSDDDGIGLGTAYKEMDICLRGAAGAANEITRIFTVDIGAVSRGLLHICLGQMFYNQGMRPFQIITFQSNHNISSFSISVPDYRHCISKCSGIKIDTGRRRPRVGDKKSSRRRRAPSYHKCHPQPYTVYLRREADVKIRSQVVPIVFT